MIAKDRKDSGRPTSEEKRNRSGHRPSEEKKRFRYRLSEERNRNGYRPSEEKNRNGYRSSEEKPRDGFHPEGTALKLPFLHAAVFLVDTLDLTSPVRGNRRIKRELDAISSGRRGRIREYYIQKIQVLLVVLLAGMMLTGVLFLTEWKTERSLEELTLERPDYGEGSRTEELEAQMENGSSRLLEVTIQDRKYTEEEKKQLLRNAADQLEQLVLAENPSPDEVRSSLFFPETLENGAVQADWTTMPYGVVDEEGTILETVGEEGTLVQIQCILTCQGEETDCSFAVKVFPPKLSGEEQMWKKLDGQVSQADSRDSTKQTMTLPQEIGGSKIIWRTPPEDTPKILLVLTVLAVLCVYVGMDGKIHRQAEQRENQLALDYPDLMWKLAMLTGAGLTMKSSFRRIGEQYRRSRYEARRFAYEEILNACYEMDSGVPEAEAYERFGRRCQLTSYIRLGSYLSQNLKKGSRGLEEFLVREATSALEERKNNARKIGERAGTRLLLPMVLMLGVVIAVLMVPAFMVM